MAVRGAGFFFWVGMEDIGARLAARVGARPCVQGVRLDSLWERRTTGL